MALSLGIMGAGAANAWRGAEDESSAVSAKSGKPMTIAASCVGRFAGKVYSWYLSVNSAGQAEVTVETLPRTRRTFLVPERDLLALRSALDKARLFALDEEYGRAVTDGSVLCLTVTVGGRTKSVRILYMRDWVPNDKAKLREASQAKQLAVVIRGWFDDPRAAGP